MAVELEVNGEQYRLDVDPGRTLLEVLRNELDLTGPKYGCGEGQCGACTVLLDGRAVHSCLTPLGGAAWKRVTTIEGLARDGRLHAVQEAFLEEGAMQCGYCIPGMIMTAVGLLSAASSPGEQEIAAAMNGNVCRCGTYPRIVAAVRRAAGGTAVGGADAGPDSPLSSARPEAAGSADAADTGGVGGAGIMTTERREIELQGHGRTRREFLKVPGRGLVVALVTSDAFGAPRFSAPPRESGNTGQQAEPEIISAWLYIAGDGGITAYTGKVEVGQGIRTSLAQELAEELRVPVSAVALVMGDTELSPWDMGTFGSRSTPQAGTQLRQVGAAARELLIGLAAEHWGVSRDDLTAQDGRVMDAHAQRSLGYGELTAGRDLTRTVRGAAALTPAVDWRRAGRSVPRTTGRDVVTGRLKYPSDIRLPGMLYGKVLRPPAVGAQMVSVDLDGARSMADVVVTHEGDFVGVAAPTLPQAARALGVIQATWRRTPQPSQAELFEHLRTTRPEVAPRLGEFGGPARFLEGDVAVGMKQADHTLEQTYTVAYIAHVPLEPRAAVARWDGGRLTVWTGTQRPFGVRDELARTLSVPQENVRVITPDTGSGYGGKHTGECAVEAARLARAAGRPVRLAWSREEEFRWAYFRPAGVLDVSAGVRKDGTITAWEFDNYNSGSAGIRTIYTIPNQRIEFHPSESPFRQGSYRALAATANHFAREMHVDELASLVGLDPLELRLRNLKDARMIAAFRAAAERFGWGASPPAGHGFGIAGGLEKGGYVATCAEVAVSGDGAVGVERVVTAFDCGAVVNPDNLKNQIVGATIQGLGGALFEEIDFEDGVITTDRLSLYRVPRLSDVPRIEIVILDRRDEPSMGAGETPLIALAPAIGAAVAMAAGVRPRSLPMARHGIRA